MCACMRVCICTNQCAYVLYVRFPSPTYQLLLIFSTKLLLKLILTRFTMGMTYNLYYVMSLFKFFYFCVLIPEYLPIIGPVQYTYNTQNLKLE